MLTARQERFCQEYVIDLNGTQAAIRAGYSKKTAVEQASQTLAILNVKVRIKELQAAIGNRLEITADMVVKELWALGIYNVQDLVTEENQIINIKQAERDLIKPVIGLKATTKVVTFDGTREETTTIDVKFADKRAALVDVGRHLGVFEKDNSQKKDDITVNINRASGKR